jgi:hypothetical protein
VEHSLKVPQLKTLLRSIGRSTGGNKPELIVSTLRALEQLKAMSMTDPSNASLQIFLQRIALENGGSLEASYAFILNWKWGLEHGKVGANGIVT